MQGLAITTDRGSLTFTAPRIQSSYLKKHLKPTRVCFGSFPNSRLLLSGSQKPIVPLHLVTASSSKWDVLALDSDIFEKLSPAVVKRAEVLIEIEEQYVETQVKFLEERSVLEAKYLKLYEPLFTKRYDIVNGEDEDEVGGVSDFWLTVLKNNEITGKDINERDEDALKYLKDIKWSIRKGKAIGFKLEFCFDQNPYFKNSVLTREYSLEHQFLDFDNWKTEGTRNIEWYPGNCLIGSKSFFNLFNPAEYGIRCLIAKPWRKNKSKDLVIGKTIKHEIIPHAVSWFTGNLSPVLREIQKQCDEVEANYLEERAGLEAKYYKLYQALYTKRYEIVNGVVEVEGEGEDKSAEEKGVPDFWLRVLKRNAYNYEVHERDEDALKYLKDIKWSRIEEKDSKWWSKPEEPNWWKIEFFFDDKKNPYFKNSVLTKTYHMTHGDIYVCLNKVIGTEIEWYPGNCLTREDFVSFFHFFSPSPNHYHDCELNLALDFKYKILPEAATFFVIDVILQEDPIPDYATDDDYWEEVFTKQSQINSKIF